MRHTSEVHPSNGADTAHCAAFDRALSRQDGVLAAVLLLIPGSSDGESLEWCTASADPGTRHTGGNRGASASLRARAGHTAACSKTG